MFFRFIPAHLPISIVCLFGSKKDMALKSFSNFYWWACSSFWGNFTRGGIGGMLFYVVVAQLLKGIADETKVQKMFESAVTDGIWPPRHFLFFCKGGNVRENKFSANFHFAQSQRLSAPTHTQMNVDVVERVHVSPFSGSGKKSGTSALAEFLINLRCVLLRVVLLSFCYCFAIHFLFSLSPL